jgi:hypothetical protein
VKRRFPAVVAALIVGLSITGLALAGQPWSNEKFQQKLDRAPSMNFEGTVMSHDVVCHCVAVKSANDSAGMIVLLDYYAKFEPDYDRTAGLTVGSKVRGTYKTVDYIDYALEFHEGK